MSHNSLDNNNTSKDLTSLTHSTEPSINILSKLNSIANENFHQIIPPIVCEICYKADNLIKICEICKNGYHKKCLDSAFLPEPFICFNCKMQFTEDEITSIINHPYNQPLLQRKGIVDNKKIYKELEKNKKVKKKCRTNTVNTKIIELDEEKNNNYNDNDNEKSQEGNNNKTGTNLHKKKNSKKINGNNLVENMNKDNNDKMIIINLLKKKIKVK